MAGYLRPSILWHLKRAGSATISTLSRLMGHRTKYLHKVLRSMRDDALIVERCQSPGVYELTAKGMAEARAVDVRDVESAAPLQVAAAVH